MGVELAGRGARRPKRTWTDPPRSSIDELILEQVGAAVAEAIERAEQRGEERGRALKTHLSVPEAAEALGVSDTHCRSLINEGVIPSMRLGTRIVIPRRALEQLGAPAP